MGQALDRDGRVLGEAYGMTKQEVLEKLNAAHKDAYEIRIKTINKGGRTPSEAGTLRKGARLGAKAVEMTDQFPPDIEAQLRTLSARIAEKFSRLENPDDPLLGCYNDLVEKLVAAGLRESYALALTAQQSRITDLEARLDLVREERAQAVAWGTKQVAEQREHSHGFCSS